MVLVDSMVKSSEQKLSDSAATLQAILAAAADENGEWYLPLSPQQVRQERRGAAQFVVLRTSSSNAPVPPSETRHEKPLAPDPQVKAVRDAMERNAEALDEALLSNCFAYIKKASGARSGTPRRAAGRRGAPWLCCAARPAGRLCKHQYVHSRPRPGSPCPPTHLPDDRFDSLVALLQKVLQLYAARALRGPESSGVDGFLNDLVYAEEADWDRMLSQAASSGEVRCGSCGGQGLACQGCGWRDLLAWLSHCASRASRRAGGSERPIDTLDTYPCCLSSAAVPAQAQKGSRAPRTPHPPGG